MRPDGEPEAWQGHTGGARKGRYLPDLPARARVVLVEHGGPARRLSSRVRRPNG